MNGQIVIVVKYIVTQCTSYRNVDKRNEKLKKQVIDHIDII